MGKHIAGDLGHSAYMTLHLFKIARMLEMLGHPPPVAEQIAPPRGIWDDTAPTELGAYETRPTDFDPSV